MCTCSVVSWLDKKFTDNMDDYTTSQQDQANAAFIINQGKRGNHDDRRGDIEDFKEVEIDTGKFKYVLIKIKGQ
eukprot:Ihof_evm1s758 gene=Ihof_evmTU1s758